MTSQAGGGLKRFVRTRPGAQQEQPDHLQRFLDPERRKRPGESCEMCAELIGEMHSHVVNLETRSLLCTCRACYLLFTTPGAAGGRYRAVPDRYLFDPAFELTEARWDELQIPVAMAFFFRNSSLDRFVTFYPSPGGATESLLDLESWREVMGANPAFGDVEPDVEALLVYRPVGDGPFECYLAPIDACYELVGRVKMNWKGFGGGEEAWKDIRGFFAGLRERSREIVHGT
ncbi:MAG: DUF5947 family protein [Actinomycetota bacterium]